ncbi:hypothetical protein BGW80DRAFT_348942 [Lactifluus volemus]|nr:hypothetical protein BGW80DRAFT_348942 [Lactifluus volemus]
MFPMAEVIDESIRNMTSNMVTKLEVAENRRHPLRRRPRHHLTPRHQRGRRTPLPTSTRSCQSQAQSHSPQHTTPRSPVVNAPPPSSSASTPVSVPPPAAHIPTSPQSGFGGPSPTSALHPSNQLAGWDSMFNVLAAQVPAKFDHLVPPRLSYKVDNNNSKRKLSGHIPCRLGRCRCRFPGRQ